MTGKENAREIYGDIIDIPHWEPLKHERMSLFERAAQFSPFAALTGYDEMIDEEAREVDAQEELSDEDMDLLNTKLNLIADTLEEGHHPLLKFTYFISDKLKEGGSYVNITERVRKIDVVGRKIQLYKTVGLSKGYMELDMDKIGDISGELVDRIE